MDIEGVLGKPLASVPFPWLLRQFSRWRLLRRLGRLHVRELIQLQMPVGDLLGVVQKSLVRFDNSGTECHTVFQVKDGGRPKGLVITPKGHIFVGEYWSNPRRQSLRIWGSVDHGKSWNLAYCLPPGSAKHIHNLVWDQFRQGIWVLTGDADGECAILFTDDEFQTVSECIRGSQMVRACNIFCLPEGIYYGTDTETTENWVIFLDVKDNKVHKIFPLPGSCMHSALMAGNYYISTAVEPSKVNHYQQTVLWESSDLQNWKKVIRFAKDLWPGRYLGYGNIILPRVQGNCPIIIFSTYAVKEWDLTAFAFRPDNLGFTPSKLAE